MRVCVKHPNLRAVYVIYSIRNPFPSTALNCSNSVRRFSSSSCLAPLPFLGFVFTEDSIHPRYQFYLHLFQLQSLVIDRITTHLSIHRFIFVLMTLHGAFLCFREKKIRMVEQISILYKWIEYWLIGWLISAVKLGNFANNVIVCC